MVIFIGSYSGGALVGEGYVYLLQQFITGL